GDMAVVRMSIKKNEQSAASLRHIMCGKCYFLCVNPCGKNSDQKIFKEMKFYINVCAAAATPRRDIFAAAAARCRLCTARASGKSSGEICGFLRPSDARSYDGEDDDDDDDDDDEADGMHCASRIRIRCCKPSRNIDERISDFLKPYRVEGRSRGFLCWATRQKLNFPLPNASESRTRACVYSVGVRGVTAVSTYDDEDEELLRYNERISSTIAQFTRPRARAQCA
ncbi:unnamed protein product, partial [Trichogramma brassicae]